MAGEWIPIRKGIETELEVLRLSVLAGLPPYTVVGILVRFWSWVDSVTDDGVLLGVKLNEMSRICHDAPVTFWKHLCDVGWLQECECGMKVPNFDAWMGNSAKKRLKAARRQRYHRNGEQGVTLSSRSGSDESVTTVQESTEKKKEASASFCPETGGPSPGRRAAAPPKAVLLFPVDGPGPREWGLTEAKLAEYRAAFPSLDVLAECRDALQWVLDNPGSRKTASGMTRYLGNWLRRSQNSGKGRRPPANADGPGAPRQAPGKAARERAEAEERERERLKSRPPARIGDVLNGIAGRKEAAGSDKEAGSA